MYTGEMNESKGQQSMEEELLFANKGLRNNSLALLIIPCVTLCRLIHASEFQGLSYLPNRHHYTYQIGIR